MQAQKIRVDVVRHPVYQEINMRCVWDIENDPDMASPYGQITLPPEKYNSPDKKSELAQLVKKCRSFVKKQTPRIRKTGGL